MATTEKELADRLRQVNREIYGNGNLDLIEDYVAEDYVEYNSASPGPIRGRDGYRENVEMVRTAFPDLEVTTEHVVVEGQTAVNHWTIRGTHEGPLMGIEPTGKEVEIEGISIGRFVDGKVVEGWTVADMFGTFQQLGIVDAPGE